MIATRLLSLAALAAFLSVPAAQGQTLSRDDGPAELPPAGYDAGQYVDSRGCVYVRAGLSGAVSWVPRVNRDRRLICGQTPSVVAMQGAATPAVPAPAPRVTAAAPTPAPASPAASSLEPRKPSVQIQGAESDVPRQVVQASPAAPQARTRAPAALVGPVPGSRAAASGVQAYAARNGAYLVTGTDGQSYLSSVPPATGGTTSGTPRRAIFMPVPSAPDPAPGAIAKSNDMSVPSLTYVAPGQQAVMAQAPALVRPPAPDPAGATVTMQRVEPQSISPDARILPRHVWEERQLTLRETPVPKGYKPVFTDGRLNPSRAEQSLRGKQQMEQIWSDTVPRRLIGIRAREGSAVNVYRPTTPAAGVGQGAASAYLTPSSYVPTAPQAHSGYREAIFSTQDRAAPRTDHRIEERATSPARAEGASHRFVQIGTFAQLPNARFAAQRLGGAGLPVQLARYNVGEQTFRVVLAGPFLTQGELSEALSVARMAGFKHASLRN